MADLTLGIWGVVLSDYKVFILIITTLIAILLCVFAVIESSKDEKEKEKYHLMLEIAEWRNGFGKLQWHDNRTNLQRLIAHFGRKKVERMIWFGLLYEHETQNEPNRDN